MDKHITDGQITIDIREYRELIEEAAYYRAEYHRILAAMAKEASNG